jgi:TolA-binding protein
VRALRILLHAVLAAAAALAAAAGITGAAARLAQDDDVARRTFANAEQLLREGKSEQGLRDFAQVATAFPTSDLADDALYRIGAFLYPAETVAALGKADAASLARAREQFEKIRTQYPQGDAAPAALFKLGLIDLEPANPKRSADEAYAHFTSVTNIYPDSGMVPDALFGAGWVDFAAGRHAKAIGPLQRLAEEYPSAPEAEEALQLMGMAYARLGQYPRALDQFQALRDRFPSGALRDRALDRLTQIYRIRMRPAWGIKPALIYDASFAPALEPEFGKSEVAMAVMPDGTLRLLDCKTGAQITLGANGKVAARASTPGARWLQVDPNGIVTLAFQSKVQVGPNVLVPGDPQGGGGGRPLQDVAAALRLADGRTALLAEGRNELLAYGADPARPQTLYRDPEGKARLSGLMAGAAGKLYTVDRRGKRLLELAPTGQARDVPLPVQPPMDPAAAAADDLGTLYILDRTGTRVVILGEAGEVVQTIASQPGGSAELGYVSALAVGPRAEVYLYDSKRRTILRYR